MIHELNKLAEVSRMTERLRYIYCTKEKETVILYDKRRCKGCRKGKRKYICSDHPDLSDGRCGGFE